MAPEAGGGHLSDGWRPETRRYVLAGRVQGVGYRAFAARAARSLGLTGGATNREDGSVEVVATGPLHALERLEAALREGPRMARVDRLEMEIVDPSTISAESFDAVF